MKKLLFLLLPILSFANEAIITKVVDGDTLHVQMNGKEEKIRILYIDTPEKHGGAKLEKDAKRWIEEDSKPTTDRPGSEDEE